MIAKKMSHAVADCFRIRERGYLREGYYADLVVVDRNKKHLVTPESLLYKCGWSPFEGHTFQSTIDLTMVNGMIRFQDGEIIENGCGMRMEFDR
jgi:dihydroorotase